jgi:hypothetical protein
MARGTKADTAYDNRTTVEVCGHEIEIEASNLAQRLYAEESEGKVDPPLVGRLIEDVLAERKLIIEDRGPLSEGQALLFEWREVPRFLCAIWAMARAAGSVDKGFAGFVADVDHGASSLYEASTAMGTVLGDFGERTFFRLPAGLGDALGADEA